MRQNCLRFKERKSSFEEVVKIVNFRYRHYQYGHSDELIKTRFRYTGCRGLFLKYNKANNTSSTEKKGIGPWMLVDPLLLFTTICAHEFDK